MERKPEQHIFNVGNHAAVSVREWAELCYQVTGKEVEFVSVLAEVEQRNYFSFYDYEYYLDVSRQCELMKEAKPLHEGLKEAFDWYIGNMNQVNKKTLLDYIDNYLL